MLRVPASGGELARHRVCTRSRDGRSLPMTQTRHQRPGRGHRCPPPASPILVWAHFPSFAGNHSKLAAGAGGPEPSSPTPLAFQRPAPSCQVWGPRGPLPLWCGPKRGRGEGGGTDVTSSALAATSLLPAPSLRNESHGGRQTGQAPPAGRRRGSAATDAPRRGPPSVSQVVFLD